MRADTGLRKWLRRFLHKKLFHHLSRFFVGLRLAFEHNETFEKCSILFKVKEGESFNRRNTLSILRIKLKLHFVQNVESDAEIGQKGTFCKGLII